MPTPPQIYGRPTFTGSGVSGDYFPEAPDLSYLGGRPEFIPEEHNYDPSLDVEHLVKSGVSIPEALHIQQVRAQAHQGAAENRIANDARGAMEALKGVDFTSPHHPNDLLKIFSRFPNARKSKEVLDQVNFFRALKPEETNLDIESITDPILYSKAKAEGWDKLPKTEAARKLATETHNRNVLSTAIENGLSEEDLKDTLDPTGIYDPLKVAHKVRMGRYDPTQETDPRLMHQAISEGWDKLTKPEAARKRTAALLNLGIEDDAEAMGVPAEELAPFKNEDTGVYDIGKVKGHLRQYASKIKTYPTEEIAKYTAKAAEERDALMSDTSKLEYLQQKYNAPKQTEFTPEQWDEAFKVLSARKTPSEEALASIQSAMGGKPVQATPQSTEAKGSLPAVNTKSEYDALPDGAQFLWNGKPITKGKKG